MNKLLFVAAMIMTSMAINLQTNSSVGQKSADFATVQNFATILLSTGSRMMSNVALSGESHKESLHAAPIEDEQLFQLNSHDDEKDLAMEVKSLKSLAQTKVLVFGQIWTVFDWTILIIVVVMIVVLTLILVIFCCCFDDKKPEDPMMEKMEEKKEEEKMDMMMEPEMMAAE